MLKGKTVLVGVTGGIASYKMANCVSMLIKLGADVHVLMTQNATNFINPITFETLTGNKCIVDTFDRNFQFNVAHVSLAKKADVFLISPATANIIGKIANGIADDMLTTTVMAFNKKVIIAPAMNTQMYHNPILQLNLQKLRKFGYEIIAPDSGRLACGDTGEGKMPAESVLVDYVLKELAHENDMSGLKVIISAGPTQEAMDPVRYITNHSSGKMGYELAKAAMRRGASVTLVSGVTNLEKPRFVETIDVISAQDMFEVFKSRFKDYDIIIKAAAVADYKPSVTADEKIKKKDSEMSISLSRTPDIIKYMGENRRDGQLICGFSMETQNMVENSRTKLDKKHIDMVVANNLKESGAGFGTDTNIVTIITKDSIKPLKCMSKEEVSMAILDEILINIKK
ncbi:MAG: bifunctional phosphopantothenoylcysteine decarboxylase/phosphopantothenate--cysteine ligase CoaBC [Clostridia bacterium]|jgi:phosphopantothenoylcysteine decarboxylase/phosphopantothenate--cysteine ligase|nr:bifunctional phosphopantothenoylcysteine decarboxylase/phosphopantothenate--cysteine ligase CoaBC [Clostridia bacterium]MCI1999376.1 bifunctional phosphopantothenoylcysteine decarboxylase/phosphopantothenate--cysteine ligase CoaBC [Clostridia bacterium]MCI2015122.1 bifunctional phosphopantothenoylcysteine decarboxylase/phosphopantothenate--cysteine ligase CoaBC [Clostridia bacterium]